MHCDVIYRSMKQTPHLSHPTSDQIRAHSFWSPKPVLQTLQDMHALQVLQTHIIHACQSTRMGYC